MTNRSPFINPEDCRTCGLCCVGCKRLDLDDLEIGIFTCTVYEERAALGYGYCEIFPTSGIPPDDCPHKKVQVKISGEV
jgi:MinD superfamily P-loop ATPase